MRFFHKVYELNAYRGRRIPPSVRISTKFGTGRLKVWDVFNFVSYRSNTTAQTAYSLNHTIYFSKTPRRTKYFIKF